VTAQMIAQLASPSANSGVPTMDAYRLGRF